MDRWKPSRRSRSQSCRWYGEPDHRCWSTGDLITTKTRTRRTRKLVKEREERRKRAEWKEQKTVNNEPKLNWTVSVWSSYVFSFVYCVFWVWNLFTVYKSCIQCHLSRLPSYSCVVLVFSALTRPLINFRVNCYLCYMYCFFWAEQANQWNYFEETACFYSFNTYIIVLITYICWARASGTCIVSRSGGKKRKRKKKRERNKS